MKLKSLFIENFKGIKDPQWIPIKPLTIFVGPNSSGKSSCIHALACLSQTIKLPNNKRPLNLDDEYAYVHLGRFIEVIHSKTYKDSLKLGFKVDEASYPVRITDKQDGKNKASFSTNTSELECLYSFKSTLRTQNIYLESAHFKTQDHQFNARRKKTDVYEVTSQSNQAKANFTTSTGFILNETPHTLPIDVERIYNFLTLGSLQATIRELLRNVLYLGPFRQPPLRRYPTRGANPVEVGPQGEATTSILANEVVQSQSRQNMSQVAKWLDTLELAKKIDINRIGTSDLFDINLTLKDGSAFPIADLGYGLSQILPVLTQCSFAPKGSILLFEQPELHLHTRSAKKLATVFIDTIKKKDATIIAETHSPDLVHQLLCELRSGAIDLEDVSIVRVKRNHGKTELTMLEIDNEDFDIYENWEEGLSR